MKTTSEAGIAQIKEFEGCKLKAYQCDAGVWTIGYGSTRLAGKPVAKGQTITLAEAEAQHRLDIKTAEHWVNVGVKVMLTQSQFDALVSIVLNVGPGQADIPGKRTGRSGIIFLRNGQPSTLLAKLNAGDYAGAAAEFEKWDRAGGKVNAGLAKRRAKERAMFEASNV